MEGPSPPAVALACVSLLVPTLALAAPALQPADFEVSHWITDADGVPQREMVEADLTSFINRARCECGQVVSTKVRALETASDAPLSTRVDAFVGPFCDTAETAPLGQFRRCGRLASEPLARYFPGFEAAFHPVFLANGVAIGSIDRDVNSDTIVAAGSCEGAFGQSGLWVCALSNGFPDCQPDEFFIDPLVGALSGIPALTFDFAPPVAMPQNLSVEPGNGSVRLSWKLQSPGDIAGLRVLCEQADGTSVGLDFPAPGVTDNPAGQHYVNAANLCEGGAFSTVQMEPAPPPAACGNGHLDPGEACDDGDDNSDDGLCASDCTLRVSPDLHALKWDRVCSDHVSFTDDSVVIDGLENGVAHDFVLVSYDSFGNPRALAQVVRATPDASLPDLAPDAGCGCVTGPSGHAPLAMSLGTLALALLSRRRRL